MGDLYLHLCVDSAVVVLSVYVPSWEVTEPCSYFILIEQGTASCVCHMLLLLRLSPCGRQTAQL